MQTLFETCLIGNKKGAINKYKKNQHRANLLKFFLVQLKMKKARTPLDEFIFIKPLFSVT